VLTDTLISRVIITLKENWLKFLQQIDLPLFSFSAYREISFLNFNIYIEEVLQQIDFPHFYMKREMRCLPFLLGIGEKILGIEKK